MEEEVMHGFFRFEVEHTSINQLEPPFIEVVSSEDVGNSPTEEVYFRG